MEYKAPAPPEGTGRHRYVVVVMVAKNGTTEGLELTVPKERRHWGYGGERNGVREWAKDNGLKVVGKSFCFCFTLLFGFLRGWEMDVACQMSEGEDAMLASCVDTKLGYRLLTSFIGANFIYAQNDKQ